MNPATPGWLTRIAERLLPAAGREHVLADLHEDFASRSRRGDRATWWFLAQLMHLVIMRPHVPRHRVVSPDPSSRLRAPMLSTLWQDARFGVRLLRRQPVFTVVAVASLAIGIGLNSTIFTVVDALLFRPMAVHAPERLATIFTTGEDGSTEASSSWPDVLDIRARNTVFTDVLGHTMMFAAVNIAGVNGCPSGKW